MLVKVEIGPAGVEHEISGYKIRKSLWHQKIDFREIFAKSYQYEKIGNFFPKKWCCGPILLSVVYQSCSGTLVLNINLKK